MAKRDYYEILAVARSASDDDLKRAYRKLAINYHPDKNPGDKEAEEKFKEINEAYQILSDPKKRQAYDQFGHAGVGGGGFEGGFGGPSFTDIFDNIFGDIFGGGGGGGRAQGVDLRYHMELTFEEAAFGTEKKINFEKEAACDTCLGSGAKAGTRPVVCKTCRGAGQVRFNQGFFTMSRSCPQCDGRGSVITEKCSSCRGRGKIKRSHSVSVKVPAGIDSDQRLRLRGEGEIGEPGGDPGDLYVQIRIKEHAIFKRESEHVILEMPISLVQAALGAELGIPTISGPFKMKIAPGTQSGEIKKLRGKGIARVNGSGFGDQIVRFHVETPKHLTSHQRKLLEEFGKAEDAKSQPGVWDFLQKVKELFG